MDIEIENKAKGIPADGYLLTKEQQRYLPFKRLMDIILSIGGIIVLSPLLLTTAIAIKIDTSGPVFFRQKRVGKDKELFEILKFRTMRTDTPKDIPTHLLSDPDRFITRVGKILRKTSMDELPQIFNILSGRMSVCGPRPALWNQDDLVAERDKYGANQVTPGLTGWAQINGRDELEIPVKAKFDGEYVEKLGFVMDIKCFLGTIGSVLNHDGVVEGGTGEMKKVRKRTDTVSPDKVKKEILIGGSVVLLLAGLGAAGISLIRNSLHSRKTDKMLLSYRKRSYSRFLIIALLMEMIVTIYTNIKRSVRLADQFVLDNYHRDTPDMDHKNSSDLKKILITGANSYIGTSVENWLNDSSYQIDTVDMIGDGWKKIDFSQYDVVYHVAGIAHADVGSVSEEQKRMYYVVNTDLAVETAKKAKQSGVRQFIFMSSMIIYSGCKETLISEHTKPNPLNFYGDSKLQADLRISSMADEMFKVVILRPPMIYGKGSKGNYNMLSKIARTLPVFPIVKNRRSMLHIDNLCEFVKLMIDNEETGIFFPQNEEYTNTSDMVQMIANEHGHRIIMIPGTNLIVKALSKIPGSVGELTKKAFGDSAYEMSMSNYRYHYRVNSLRQSIKSTEEDED